MCQLVETCNGVVVWLLASRDPRDETVQVRLLAINQINGVLLRL